MDDLPLFSPDERLAELEAEKARLFEELARVAEEQKALAKEVYSIERQQRVLLRGIEEHVVEGPLSHEDIERWVRSVHWQYAKSMASNPHHYAHIRWCNPEMFQAVTRHIREHGYIQHFAGSGYWTYDLADSFIWTNSGEGGYRNPKPIEQLILINRKPMSLRPG